MSTVIEVRSMRVLSISIHVSVLAGMVLTPLSSHLVIRAHHELLESTRVVQRVLLCVREISLVWSLIDLRISTLWFRAEGICPWSFLLYCFPYSSKVKICSGLCFWINMNSSIRYFLYLYFWALDLELINFCLVWMSPPSSVSFLFLYCFGLVLSMLFG